MIEIVKNKIAALTLCQRKHQKTKTMTINELFTGDNLLMRDIFYKEHQADYTAIFGNQIPQTYDVLISLKCGDKVVSDKVTVDNCKDVVNAIINANVANWKQAAKTMQLEFDTLNPVRRKTTTTGKGTENQTANDANTESIKAFNDTDFTPDNKNESNNTKERTTTDERTETITGFDGDVYSQLRKDFAFRLDNWRESIIFAIVKEITLSIY